MNKKSGILAIMLSLSIVGSARAGLDNWLLGSIVVTNVGPYVGAAVNMATNMGNLYLNYRNGQRIETVGQEIKAVGTKVDAVGANVVKVGNKVDRTNTLMGALHQETRIGFGNVNAQLAENSNQIQIVHRNIANLAREQQANMETLTGQYETISGRLSLVEAGVLGVHDRLDANARDMQALTRNAAETQSTLRTLNASVTEFKEFVPAVMRQMAALEALMQTIAARLPDNTAKKESNN